MSWLYLSINCCVDPEFSVKELLCKVFATLISEVHASAGHSPPPLSINVSRDVLPSDPKAIATEATTGIVVNVTVGVV